LKLTGRQGVLRILDGSKNLHGAAPRDDAAVDMVTFNGVATWANITSNCDTDDGSSADNFLGDNDDVVYVGSTVKFALIRFLKDIGAHYAVGSGALIMYYFNGTDFNSQPSNVTDGTASGGDCFAADGYIGFDIPRDWAVGANAFNANLDSNKYYVALMCTTSPSTDPDADVLCPCDGQYFEVIFAGMDSSGPISRSMTEEMLVLNRNKMDSYAHYIEGPDDAIYAPLDVSFSCMIDDTVNRERIMLALECGNPNDSARWTSAGTTTKSQTKNDGTNYNPAFKDSTKKTVNVQILWTGTNPIGMAYYECFAVREAQSISEAEDGVTLSCTLACYGLIKKIFGLANRY
jgi:hypothetical protein